MESLQAMGQKPITRADLTFVSEGLRLIDLQLKMLRWIKTYIDSMALDAGAPRVQSHVLSSGRNSLRDLNWIGNVARRLYPCAEVPHIEIRLKRNRDIRRGFEELEAILILLVMNAGEATTPGGFTPGYAEIILGLQRKPHTSAAKVPIKIVIKQEPKDSVDFLVLSVSDYGCGFDWETQRQINDGRAVACDGFPGGGLLLARYLTASFGPTAFIEVTSHGKGSGATAVFGAPWSRFDS
jgi:hypothetical protein